MEPVGVDETWLVMIYAFLVHSIVDGLGYTIGLIGTQLIERRNYNRELVAWIQTILTSCVSISAAIVTPFSRKFGYRIAVMLGGLLMCTGFVVTGLSDQDAITVYLLIGILSGIGYSLAYIPTFIAANTYYKERRQFANGWVMSGSAIGVVVLPPIVHFLMEWYGLQGTFMILGGIALNIVVIGALIPPLKESDPEPLKLKTGTKDDRKQDQKSMDEKSPIVGSPKKKSLHLFVAVDLFSHWKYTVFIVAVCLADPVLLHTFYTYIPDYVIQSGYSQDAAWQMITICGVTNTVTKLCMGLSNKSSTVIMLVYSLNMLLFGLILLCYAFPPVATCFWLLFLLAALSGFSKGSVWSLKGPVLAELVAMENFDRAFGTMQFCKGFFVLLCPLQGKLYDVTGEYIWTFVMSGTMATVGGCLLLVVAFSFVSLRRRNYIY